MINDKTGTISLIGRLVVVAAIPLAQSLVIATPADAQATAKPQGKSTTNRQAPKSAGKPATRPGQIDDYDYGSVYCHQGCAGGFTGVLKGTATNPGMKR